MTAAPPARDDVLADCIDWMKRQCTYPCSPEDRCECDGLRDRAAAWRDAQAAEIADLKTSVIAFGVLWGIKYAQANGLPCGHLHPEHYDILARAGARMDDFTRAEVAKP
jgi:hypothetical protein